MFPLSFLKAGEDGMVARIGGDTEAKQHLADLGFVPGAVIHVVSTPGNGNIIISLKDSRLALTSQMAEKITVAMDRK